MATDRYLLISKICLPQKGYTFIKRSPCSLNINAEWQTLKSTLQQAANEALGRRMKRRHRRRLILWNEDIKNLIENKKKAYLPYLTNTV